MAEGSVQILRQVWVVVAWLKSQLLRFRWDGSAADVVGEFGKSLRSALRRKKDAAQPAWDRAHNSAL